MNRGLSPRHLSALLGAWLVLSSFCWQHSPAQFNNAYLIGIATVIFALTALRSDKVRYANALLAIWLFLAAWALPISATATFWNDVLVAIAMFIAALTPGVPTRHPGPRGQGPIIGIGR